MRLPQRSRKQTLASAEHDNGRITDGGLPKKFGLIYSRSVIQQLQRQQPDVRAHVKPEMPFATGTPSLSTNRRKIYSLFPLSIFVITPRHIHDEVVRPS